MTGISQALGDLARRHPEHVMRKFFLNPDSWERQAISIARTLGLDGAPPQRILDLGCGVGYFVRASRQLGHAAEGLDVPDPVLREAAGYLGVEYIPHVIGLATRLPDWLVGFHTITMMGVNLRVRATRRRWAWPEFRQFASDIWPRIALGGRWVIRPNLGPQQTFVLDPRAWRELLGSCVHPQASVDQIILLKTGDPPWMQTM